MALFLSVSENGYGKRSSYLDYRVTNRGGKGIIGIINSPRNGNISSSLVVSEMMKYFYLQIKEA